MKLRRPCEHGKYDPHNTSWVKNPDTPGCPGGVFLPDDTLVIEPYEFEGRRFWPEWASFGLAPDIVSADEVLDALYALSVREAEPDKNQMGMW